MFTAFATDPNDAYQQVVDALNEQAFAVESRNGRTKELHPAIIEIKDTSHRLITPYGRPVNPAFALAEVVWILSGHDDVATLKHYNSNIGEYSDDGETFNAAYGYRLRHEFNFDQLDDMITGLRMDPDSRQAILNIWSPAKDRAIMHWDTHALLADNQFVASRDSIPVKNDTKDRACNLLSHAMIRNGKLDWVQMMRSNDVVWGMPNNFMQWMHIHEYVANAVGVPLGRYWHFADSLHVYEAHWYQLRHVKQFDLYRELGQPGHMPLNHTRAALNAISATERSIREDDVRYPDSNLQVGYWSIVATIFEAWKCYKEGQDHNAFNVLMQCPDRVLAAAQMRYFWWWRWHKIDREFTLGGNHFPQSVWTWIQAGHS